MRAAGEVPVPLSPEEKAPVAERRLVSVLFADLVGFTTLSKNRDAEEVRELLTRYFDTCHRLMAAVDANQPIEARGLAQLDSDEAAG